MTDKIDPRKSSLEAQRWGAFLGVVEMGADDSLLARGRGYLDPLLRAEGVNPARRQCVFMRAYSIEHLVDLAFMFLVMLEDEQKPHRRAFLARQLERVWTSLLRRWRKTNAAR